MEEMQNYSGLSGLGFNRAAINNIKNGQQAKTRALMEYKIDELAKKVEKHNSVVERTFLLEEKLKIANHRIEDLERKVE